MHARGQFHKTFFVNQKAASAQSLAKISRTKLRPNLYAEICQICSSFGEWLLILFLVRAKHLEEIDGEIDPRSYRIPMNT